MRTKQVAEVFGVSRSWVRRVMQRRRETGQTAARPRGGVTVVKIDLDRLRQLVQQQPDATVRELHGRLSVDCSLSAVDMALRRLGLTFKKRRSTQRNRTAPTSLHVVRCGSGSSRIATSVG
jgi:transposase